MDDTFPQTARTTASRDRHRVTYTRATANAILDEGYVCHLGFTVADAAETTPGAPDAAGCAEPRVLPTLHVRLGDTLYLHGSTGSRPLLAARSPAGLPVCVTVTHLDGLVLARSQFSHSANYRSVVAHGRAYLVTDETEKLRALTALVDKIAPGRAADSRPPTRKELAETAVLALPLTEVSVKARVGGVNDEPEDYGLDHWAGVLPLRLIPGIPEPDAGVRAPVPDYLRPGRGLWHTPVVLRGADVLVEPLDLAHAPGLFAALADAEVYRWLTQPLPRTVDDMTLQVGEALRMQEHGQRIPFVLRAPATGEILGTTSYYDIDETNRAIAIGYTIISKAWWRTAVNSQTKVLLLDHAFTTLGAVRVQWHTDLQNERSQRAIERLGATREGVLRRHKRRWDGSWRDTVLYAMTDQEWPNARHRLASTTRASAPIMTVSS